MERLDLESLYLEREDGIATITLNRPDKKNAINSAMWRDLLQVLTEVSHNPADRCVVLTGAGGAFCSGADLTDPTGTNDHQLVRMRYFADIPLTLHRCPKPTIAKVGGVAVGAGLNLALGCDLVVASDEARFSEIFARRGLSLDIGGSWILPRIVGLHKAKELALLAEVIDAKEAERIGIVNRVVPAGDLDAFVGDWARRLADGPPLALSMTKTMLNNSLMVSMEQALEDEARSQAVNLKTEDTAEAMQAFIGKRAPNFQGR